MNDKHYRLPDKTTTTDIEVFEKAWDEYILPIEAAFPGYVCTSFDPGICLGRIEMRGEKKVLVGDYINLPLEFVRRMIEIINAGKK